MLRAAMWRDGLQQRLRAIAEHPAVEVDQEDSGTLAEAARPMAARREVRFILLGQIGFPHSLCHGVLLRRARYSWPEPTQYVLAGQARLQMLHLRSDLLGEELWYRIVVEVHVLKLHFADAEYRLLREMAHPEAALRHDKRYFLAPREELPCYNEEDGLSLIHI